MQWLQRWYIILEMCGIHCTIFESIHVIFSRDYSVRQQTEWFKKIVIREEWYKLHLPWCYQNCDMWCECSQNDGNFQVCILHRKKKNRNSQKKTVVTFLEIVYIWAEQEFFRNVSELNDGWVKSNISKYHTFILIMFKRWCIVKSWRKFLENIRLAFL